MTRKQGIQYETVATLANISVARGIRPEDISAGAIRKETGTGSLSTINDHLKDWRIQIQSPPAVIELTSDRMQGIVGAVSALINEADALARAEAGKAEAVVTGELEKLQALHHEALQLNERIEAEREAAVADVGVLRSELETMSLRCARLEGRIDGQARALAAFERAGLLAVRDNTDETPARAEAQEPKAGRVKEVAAMNVATAEDLALALDETLPTSHFRRHEHEKTSDVLL